MSGEAINEEKGYSVQDITDPYPREIVTKEIGKPGAAFIAVKSFSASFDKFEVVYHVGFKEGVRQVSFSVPYGPLALVGATEQSIYKAANDLVNALTEFAKTELFPQVGSRCKT